MKRGRNVAVHEVLLPDGSRIRQGMVTIVDGVVMQYRSFTGELPMTEWLGGTIRLEEDADGQLRAAYEGAWLL